MVMNEYCNHVIDYNPFKAAISFNELDKKDYPRSWDDIPEEQYTGIQQFVLQATFNLPPSDTERALRCAQDAYRLKPKQVMLIHELANNIGQGKKLKIDFQS